MADACFGGARHGRPHRSAMQAAMVSNAILGLSMPPNELDTVVLPSTAAIRTNAAVAAVSPKVLFIALTR